MERDIQSGAGPDCQREDEAETGKSGQFECFHCGCRSVIWGADFDGEDYGYTEPGIVHSLHCTNCNAEITYFVPTGENENDQERGETEGAQGEEEAD